MGQPPERFQSIGVTKDWRRLATLKLDLFMPHPEFPINRRHQGLATIYILQRTDGGILAGFQSIGVTKDWRLIYATCKLPALNNSFQSIGVTKDWRRLRRYLGVTLWGRFQSIGVTKDWRHASGGRVAAPSAVSNQ